MNKRSLILWLLVVLPGTAASGISIYYLIPEWAVLDASYKHYQQVAKSSSTVNDLLIAEAAENRHRINCFAEGIGVLLGGVIVSIGIHGLCTLPNKTS
jgi:hypothetical protein